MLFTERGTVSPFQLHEHTLRKTWVLCQHQLRAQGSETGPESKCPAAQNIALNCTLLQQTHSLRLLNTTKGKAISKSIIEVKGSPILSWERGYTACFTPGDGLDHCVTWRTRMLQKFTGGIPAIRNSQCSGRLLSTLQHWDAPPLTPKDSWDMPTVRGGQGTPGDRFYDLLWLTMPSKGALKLSSQRETVTCKSQSKKLISWYIPQKQTPTPFILSARLSFWPAFFLFFFFSYFHLAFFKKIINKAISSICGHSFSICTNCLWCNRASVSMQLNPKTTGRTFAAQVGWQGRQPLGKWTY